MMKSTVTPSLNIPRPKKDIFMAQCGHTVKVSVEFPDLSVERGSREKLAGLSTFSFLRFSFELTRAMTNQEIEEAIVQDEQQVIESYLRADLATWVVVRQLDETEKAVKVRVKVVRGEREPKPGTSQFWVPKNLFFKHQENSVVSKDFVDRKLKELQEKATGLRSRFKVYLAKPVDVICLPEADWAKFFAGLRAQIPPNVAELVAEQKLRIVRLEMERLAQEEERERSRPARIEAARVKSIQMEHKLANKEAAERARVAALETIAQSVTVFGHDWVGPSRSPRRVNWTLENVTVKKSGARAYITDANGAVLRWKPIKNITISAK